MVGVLPVFCRGEVPGRIQRGPVLLQNQAGGHFVLAQVDHPRSLALGQKPLGTQILNDRLHLVIIEAFSRIAVEMHIQDVIYPHRVLQGHILEPVEDFKGFRITFLNLLEPGSPFILQLRIVFGFHPEAHVQPGHLLHAAALHGFPVAPMLVGADHLAELGSPVPEMIDADGFIAQEIVDPFQAVSEHRRGKMSDVKALGDIDGGIVQTYGFPFALLRGAEAFSLFRQLRHDFSGEILTVQEKIHISVHRLHPGRFLVLPSLAQRFRDLRRSHPQGLCQPEARKSVISESGIRRHGQQSSQFLRRRQAFRVGPAVFHRLPREIGNPGHHVHLNSIPFPWPGLADLSEALWAFSCPPPNRAEGILS